MARGTKRAAVEAGPVEGPWELPEGWRWERLGDLCSYVSRGRGPKYVQTDGVRVINQRCVRWAGVDLEYCKLTSTDAAARLPDEQLLRDGDILWNSTGTGTIGRAAVFRPVDNVPVVADSHVTIVRLRELEPQWVWLWINTIGVQQAVAGTGSTNQVELARQTVVHLPIPVPPPDALRLLLGRIDELFAEIDDGERALASADEGLATYSQSFAKAAVSGQLTVDWRKRHSPPTGRELLQKLDKVRSGSAGSSRRSKGAEAAISNGPRSDLPELPDTWTWALLPQLGDFGRGKSKHRPRNDPRLYGGAYPFIQTGIVAGCSGVIDRYDQTYSEFGLQQSKLWPAGTVCITIAANIAMTGVLTFDACFPDSIVGLTCFDGVRPEYIELFIRTVQQELELYAPATAQKNINLETLYQLAIPLPPTAEQDIITDIARRGHGFDALFGQHQREEITSLRQSILAAAFRGDLIA